MASKTFINHNILTQIELLNGRLYFELIQAKQKINCSKSSKLKMKDIYIFIIIQINYHLIL